MSPADGILARFEFRGPKDIGCGFTQFRDTIDTLQRLECGIAHYHGTDPLVLVHASEEPVLHFTRLGLVSRGCVEMEG